MIKHAKLQLNDCPKCGQDPEIEVEIESPSDYYVLDYTCANCGFELNHQKIDDLVFDKASEFFDE